MKLLLQYMMLSSSHCSFFYKKEAAEQLAATRKKFQIILAADFFQHWLHFYNKYFHAYHIMNNIILFNIYVNLSRNFILKI